MDMIKYSPKVCVISCVNICTYTVYMYGIAMYSYLIMILTRSPLKDCYQVVQKTTLSMMERLQAVLQLDVSMEETWLHLTLYTL